MRPLEGTRVLDFSVLAAGSMAGLILAEAGAEVIAVEPKGGSRLDAVDSALLSRGKKRLAVDHRHGDLLTELDALIKSADVILMCDRPGDSRLYPFEVDQIATVNSGAICCRISGWGAVGPLSELAGEDLNYAAEAGLLTPVSGTPSPPSAPPSAMGGFAAGALPAVINILLALRMREQDGQGQVLEIAIADNLFGFEYAAVAAVADETVQRLAPSPRHGIYATSDGRYIAVAAIDDRYWENLCERLELDEELRGPTADPKAVGETLAAIFKARTAKFWRDKIENRDLCCSIVATLEEAMAHPQFRDRGIFSHQVTVGGRDIPAIAVPVAAHFRGDRTAADGPPAESPDVFL